MLKKSASVTKGYETPDRGERKLNITSRSGSKLNVGFQGFRSSISDNSSPPKLVTVEDNQLSPSPISLGSPRGSKSRRLSKSDERPGSILSPQETDRMMNFKKKLSFVDETREGMDDDSLSEVSLDLTGGEASQSHGDVVDESSSSGESDKVEIETHVHEKVTDALGNVKLITRKVKSFEKNKEKIISPLQEVVHDAKVLPTTESDEYEEIEEEVEEEIEVEEEEEEEEEEGGPEDLDEEEGEEAFEKEIEVNKLSDKSIKTNTREKKESEGLCDKGKIKEEDENKMFEKKEEGHDEHISQEELQEKEIESRDSTKGSKHTEEESFQELISDLKPKRKMKKIKVIKKVKKLIKKELKVRKSGSTSEELLSHKSSGLLKGERYIEGEENIERVNLGEAETSEVDSEHEKLIEMLKSKISELGIVKRKNKYLHKSLIDYYKHRRAFYVYEGETISNEGISRYHKRLRILEEMVSAIAAEKLRKSSELSAMRDTFQEYDDKYKEEMSELLQMETDMGKGVMDSHSGKLLDDIVTVHLVQRHENGLNKLCKVRLTFIKLQNQFTVKEAILKSLVCLEGNLNLIDYEQLLMDNQIFADKIEEREDELSHLRGKMLAVIHTYAHALEKSDAILEDIEVCRAKLANVDCKMSIVRENANKLKQYRDGLRSDTRKMKRTAGLLTRPRLAIDYENSKFQIKQGKLKLEKVIKHFNVQRSKILELRKDTHNLPAF